jgi:Tfp pilus assembly protein PilN
MTNGPSFLPDDYVRDARERRSSVVALVLFAVVMGTVFAAFLVTNRQWNDVRIAQSNVNDATEKAAKEIEEMKALEAMRAQMVEKAELARGLLEPVPRSVLLATLVNTMPGDLSLLELDLRSEEIKPPRQETPARADPRVRRAVKQEPATPPKPEPVRRRVLLTATGVAPDDLDVSRWMGALSRVGYLEGIRLEVSEEKEIRGQRMRQFKISMRIEPGADVRGWEGLQALRTPEDPMNRGALDAGRIEETPAAGPAVVDAAPALAEDPLDETLGGANGGDE